MAAVLALGRGAVLSHRDAAALHGLRASERSAIEVTTSRRTRPRRGITVHETGHLDPRDRMRIDGIPVTSVPRTLLDLTREAGLPAPEVNVLVEGSLVDAYWPSAGMVVELQGYAHHSGRKAFERDHARQVRLKLAGY